MSMPPTGELATSRNMERVAIKAYREGNMSRDTFERTVGSKLARLTDQHPDDQPGELSARAYEPARHSLIRQLRSNIHAWEKLQDSGVGMQREIKRDRQRLAELVR